jgi:hypothetical protein
MSTNYAVIHDFLRTTVDKPYLNPFLFIEKLKDGEMGAWCDGVVVISKQQGIYSTTE